MEICLEKSPAWCIHLQTTARTGSSLQTPVWARDRQSFPTLGCTMGRASFKPKELSSADSSEVRRTNFFFLRADVWPRSDSSRQQPGEKQLVVLQYCSCRQGRSAMTSSSDFSSNIVGSPGCKFGFENSQVKTWSNVQDWRISSHVVYPDCCFGGSCFYFSCLLPLSLEFKKEVSYSIPEAQR